MSNGQETIPAVPEPDGKVLDQSKLYPLNHLFHRSLTHTVLLLGIVLLGFHTFQRKPIWGALYVLFAFLGQVSWVRYVSCTRCPHYGRVCPSLLYAGILGARWFGRRSGRWDQRDWLLLVLTWAAILLLPVAFALVRHQTILALVNLVFDAGFFLVHSELGCKACRNAPYCPKGVFVHDPGWGTFVRMVPYLGERIAGGSTRKGLTPS